MRPNGTENHIQVKCEGKKEELQEGGCRQFHAQEKMTYMQRPKGLKRQTMNALLGFYTITSWPSSSFLAVCA